MQYNIVWKDVKMEQLDLSLIKNQRYTTIHEVIKVKEYFTKLEVEIKGQNA